MLPNQRFGENNHLQHRSPSSMSISTLISNARVTDYGGWGGPQQEVALCNSS